MSISYKPLFKMMIDRNIKKTDLCTLVGISPSTLSKLSKGEYVAMEVIDRLCTYFGCKVEDVIEHCEEKKD